MTVLAKMTVNNGKTGEYLETVRIIVVDEELDDMAEFEEEYGEDISDFLYEQLNPRNKVLELITRLDLVELEEEYEEV